MITNLPELLAAAAEKKEESDKLSALLLLPEVCADGRLSRHYRARVKQLDPIVNAYNNYTRFPSSAGEEALERAMLLLSVEERGDSLTYAGAGVCVRVRNINKDSLSAEECLRTLCKAASLGEYALKENSAEFLRAEWTGESVYPRLCAFARNALGNGVAFASYPVLCISEVKEEEIRTDIFLNGGKGGQNVNKVETAVRMTHTPTGVTVTCREERSQLQNKKKAAKLIRERVKEFYRAAQRALVEKAKQATR